MENFIQNMTEEKTANEIVHKGPVVCWNRKGWELHLQHPPQIAQGVGVPLFTVRGVGKQ